MSPPPDVTFVELSSEDQAETIRQIRNFSRDRFTGHTAEIGPEAQREWFRKIYLKQAPREYFVWLAMAGSQEVVGYCAIKLDGDLALFTECVAPKWQRKGIGRAMVQHLLERATALGKRAVAVILSSNSASIQLHSNYGFKNQATNSDGHAVMFHAPHHE